MNFIDFAVEDENGFLPVCCQPRDFISFGEKVVVRFSPGQSRSRKFRLLFNLARSRWRPGPYWVTAFFAYQGIRAVSERVQVVLTARDCETSSVWDC